jgi:hypothetical protein
MKLAQILLQPTLFTRAKLAALVLVSFVGARPGLAQQPILGWETIVPSARAAYAERRAAPELAAARGAVAASGEVAGPWQQLQLQSFDDFHTGEPTDHPWEITHYAQATVNLGSLKQTQQGAWRALGDERMAAALASESRFVLDAIDAYATWWELAALRAHVQAHHADLEALLAPLLEAAGDGLLSAADRRELEVELARSAALVAAAARGETAQRQRLEELWLGDVNLAAPAPLSLDAPAPTSLAAWDALLQEVSDAATRTPDEVALTAASAARRAEAEVAASANPWQLFFGVNNRFEGPNAGWLAGTIGVSIPLSNPGLAEARWLGAQSQSALAQAAVVAQTWQSRLLGMRAVHASIAAEYEALRTGLVSVSRERATELQRAYAQRLVTAERLARAWRDALEADHALGEVAAKLFAMDGRARALAAWLRDFGRTP